MFHFFPFHLISTVSRDFKAKTLLGRKKLQECEHNLRATPVLLSGEWRDRFWFQSRREYEQRTLKHRKTSPYIPWNSSQLDSRESNPETLDHSAKKYAKICKYRLNDNYRSLSVCYMSQTSWKTLGIVYEILRLKQIQSIIFYFRASDSERSTLIEIYVRRSVWYIRKATRNPTYKVASSNREFHSIYLYWDHEAMGCGPKSFKIV